MSTARPFNSWDALKLLALVLMLIDHVGHFFFPDQLWLRAIGRTAPVIFLFLIGFAPSYRTRFDIVVMGAMLSIYNIFLDGSFHPLNILLTIAACRFILNIRAKPERRIKNPFEWYVGAVACVVSMAAIQYGSLALLFALCGYMKRFASDYALRVRQIFWALTFITYGAAMAAISEFSVSETLLMIAALFPTALLLWRFEVHSVNAPNTLATIGKWASRHTAYLYAAHLAFFMWLTGVPF